MTIWFRAQLNECYGSVKMHEPMSFISVSLTVEVMHHFNSRSREEESSQQIGLL